MNRNEFQAASIALLRSAIGWQSAIARKLMVEPRQVRRWLHDDKTPPWADEMLAEMMGARELSPWPRDEWIIGDAVQAHGRRREYIIHMMPPRFAARIVEVQDDETPRPDELPADVNSGTVYTFNDCVLCEISWFDEPSPGAIAALMEAACDAIDAENERLQAEAE
jgi:hypothetical protein